MWHMGYLLVVKVKIGHMIVWDVSNQGENNENDLMQVMKHEPYIAQYNTI